MNSLTRPLSSSWRAETLTATRMFRPSRFQAAAWRAASAHDPHAQRRDQPRILGVGNEGAGADHAALGRLPAQQGLDPVQLAGAAGQQAGSAASGGRRPWPCADWCPATRNRRCGGPSRAGTRDRCGAPIHGHVHGDVGAAHHAVQVGAMFGIHGDADRAAGVDLDQPLAERLAQPLDDALRGRPSSWTSAPSCSTMNSSPPSRASRPSARQRKWPAPPP